MSQSANPYADTRDMYKVHKMFRREYALLPGLVCAVEAKDTERAQVVAGHVKLVNTILEHHHTAEDVVLWPKLLKRASRDIDPVVRLLEGQHQALDVLFDAVNGLLGTWTDGADSEDGQAHTSVVTYATGSSRASMSSSSRARIIVVIGATTAPSRAHASTTALSCHQLGS
jgi:hypothetical protein